MNTLQLAVVIILVTGLLLTIWIGRNVARRKSEYDYETKATELAKKSSIFNPVFLTYIIVLGGILIFVLYMAL
ncbi:hypothetical protein RZN25_11800 [Bacillaceae bacterium S4-13-56]